MHLDSELIDELNLLMSYRAGLLPQNKEFSQEKEIEAAKRLFAKGVIEHVDGGELTERGQAVIELMTDLLNKLSPALEPI